MVDYVIHLLRFKFEFLLTSDNEHYLDAQGNRVIVRRPK